MLCKCLICGTPPPQEDHTVKHGPPPTRTGDSTEEAGLCNGQTRHWRKQTVHPLSCVGGRRGKMSMSDLSVGVHTSTRPF